MLHDEQLEAYVRSCAECETSKCIRDRQSDGDRLGRTLSLNATRGSFGRVIQIHGQSLQTPKEAACTCMYVYTCMVTRRAEALSLDTRKLRQQTHDDQHRLTWCTCTCNSAAVVRSHFSGERLSQYLLSTLEGKGVNVRPSYMLNKKVRCHVA